MADVSLPDQPAPETPPPRTTGGNWRWEPPTVVDLQASMPGYRIDILIGRGGMGAVYRGVQLNLDRAVAIKVLPPGVEKEDPSYAERFRSEARLMARLNHPAVVGVYDFGTTSAGHLYFAMEYVDGSDVLRMINTQGRLPPAHALAITSHVCDALAAAHELGIVHRDIKPANVLLNMKGQVKVTDFGLAKVEEPGQHGLTRTGFAVGTPDFVAPEGLSLGTAIDGRADVYAVGVMLYQMLTGRVPRGAFKPAFVEVPGLDPRFDPIIMKAMQHDRAERHQSAMQLRSELDVIMTVPFVRQDAPAKAAVPPMEIAHMPAPRSVALRAPVKPGPPKISAAAAARPLVPVKSRASLLAGLGIGAALLAGAFLLINGRKQETVRPTAGLAPAQTPAPASSKEASSAKAENRAAESAQIAQAQQPASPAVSSMSSAGEPRVGQWMNLFAEGEPLSPSGQWKNGWIEGGKVIYLKDFGRQGGKNSAVRITFKSANMDGVNENYLGSIWLRNTGEAAYVMRLRRDGTVEFIYAPQAVVNEARRGADRVFHTAKVGADFEAAKPVVMEFGAVGSQLMGRVNGRVIAFIKEPTLQEGKPRVTALVPARDIEAMNLDGMDEAAALKALGVDDRGNDLRSAVAAAPAPVSKPPAGAPVAVAAPPAPVPAPASVALPSVQKFPPGQWTRVFTQYEDLPLENREPAGTVKQEAGWYVPQPGKKLVMNVPGFPRSKNHGIRAVYSVTNPTYTGEMRVRSSGSSYVMGMDATSRLDLVFNARLPDGKFERSKLQTIGPLTNWKAGNAVSVELCVVGTRLYARIDGQLVANVEDASAQEGTVGLMNVPIPVRDVEAINLDGLAEAEALKIVGVDDKGNDLRAAAVAQEKRAQEEKKRMESATGVPELVVLHEQFLKLRAERVGAPFEAEVARLNSGYLGGIAKKIAEEKDAGHLDGILALEAEQRLVQDAMSATSPGSALEEAPPPPIPDVDDAAAPASLKALRALYRTAYARSTTTRTTNLKTLIAPLDKRLALLESELARKDRVSDAKTVRSYRESLAKSTVERKPGRSSGQSKAGRSGSYAKALPGIPKYPKADERKAAEWVLNVGGKITIVESSVSRKISHPAELPKKGFALTEVMLNFMDLSPTGPIDDLTALANLPELTLVDVKNLPLDETHLAPLMTLPKLYSLSFEKAGLGDDFVGYVLQMKSLRRLFLQGNGGFTGTRLAELAELPLIELSLQSTAVTDTTLAALPRLQSVLFLNINETSITDAAMKHVGGMPRLKGFYARSFTDQTRLTSAGLQHLKRCKDVQILAWNFTPGKVAEEAAQAAVIFPILDQLQIPNFKYTTADLAALTCFKNLMSLRMEGDQTNDAALAGVAALRGLNILHLRAAPRLTDAGLEQILPLKGIHELMLAEIPEITDAVLLKLAAMKKLEKLFLINNRKLTPAGIAAFQSVRPDVKINQ